LVDALYNEYMAIKSTYKIVALGVLVVGAIAFMMFGSQAPCDASKQTCGGNTQISGRVEEVLNMAKNDEMTLIDVREPYEYAAGYIEHAINVPLGEIESGAYAQQDKDKPIYVYCRSGRRSAIAKEVLDAQGFKQVVDLGGITDWQAMGGRLIQ
jgi:rhodanese-related sulfurtransferase